MSKTLSLEHSNPALLFRPQMMIGAATPLWGYFTGAALTGMALWWMSRWMATSKLATVAPIRPPAGAAPEPAAALPVLSAAASVAPPAAAAEPEAEPILDAEFVPAPPSPRKSKRTEAKAH